MKIKHGEKTVVLKETSNDRFKGNYRVKGEDAVNSFCLLGSIIKNKRLAVKNYKETVTWQSNDE